jgi:hypothetical protein
MNSEYFNFPEQIHGFSRVEYLSVFVSLLYAFSVAEFFSGWSRMLRNRDSLIICPDHLTFTGIYFWILIINWYSLWPRIEFLNEGFLYFVLTLLPIVITYMASVFIFPDFDKIKDLNAYFDKNFNMIIYLATAFIWSNIIIGLFLGEMAFLSKTVIIRIINGSLMLIVAYFNLKKLRRPLLIFLILGLLIGSIQMAFV